MAQELKRILCIDDDEDVLAVMQLSLKTVGGYDASVCSSGVAALACIRTVRPELILLDVMMPGMDGPAVMKRIRENPLFKRTPVIFVTARVQPDEVKAYYSLGVTAVIPKPFDPMTLSKEVEAIWVKCNVEG